MTPSVQIALFYILTWTDLSVYLSDGGVLRSPAETRRTLTKKRFREGLREDPFARGETDRSGRGMTAPTDAEFIQQNC